MAHPESALPAPRHDTPLARRPVLLGLVAAATVPALGGLAACGSGEPDPLAALATRAREDAELVDAVLAQPTLRAALGARLTPVADARRQHAQALAVELGESDSDSAAAASSARAPAPQSDPDAEGALSRVRAALDRSSAQAGKLVLTLPRDRAALVGSISACCAAFEAVLR